MRRSQFKSLSYFGVSLVGLMYQASGFASGFEKSVMFSGKYAGNANAAASFASGAEALYFNPAGLSQTKNIELTGDFSPSFVRFTAPVGNNAALDSNRSFLPIGGAFVSYSPMPKLGVGVGYYVSGGAKAIYDSVDFGNGFTTTLSPTVKSDLALTELSVGAGYEIIDGLSIGASWRMMFAKANLSSASLTTVLTNKVLTAVSLTDLSDTAYNGFRVGAQYMPKNAGWGLGASWRSQVDFTASGNASANQGVNSATGTQVIAPTALTATTATASSTFPMQLSLGGFYELMNTWKFIGQYDFTQYTKNTGIAYTGRFTGVTGTVFNIPTTQQGWNNMNSYRLGVEYKGFENWPVRVGYVYTSQVVPNSASYPYLFPPGSGNSVTAGTGYQIMPGLTINGALEYSWSAGTSVVTDNPAGAAATDNYTSGGAPGDYKVNAYVVHLGATLEM